MMARSRYSIHVSRCGHPGCREEFRESCSSKAEFDKTHAYRQRNPFFCFRHRPGYVTPDAPSYTASVEYINQHVKGFGGEMSKDLFWADEDGFGKGHVNTLSCPKFAVESSLFPEGAKLRITVTVEVAE